MRLSFKNTFLFLLVLFIFMSGLVLFRIRTSKFTIVISSERFRDRTRLFDEEFRFCYNYTMLKKNIENTAYAWHNHAENLTKRNYNIEIIFTDSIHRTFSKTVNHLSRVAYIEGVDYFLLTSKNTYRLLRNKNWKAKFIQILNKHNVQNVGIVVPEERTSKQSGEHDFIFIHRSHMDVFQPFFPKKLEYKSAIFWLQEIYKPFLVTKIDLEENFETNSFRTVKFEIGNSIDNHLFPSDKTYLYTYIGNKSPINVISFSLYGADDRYTGGALANVELMKTIYPGWKMWIYHDKTVPFKVLSTLCSQYHVQCIDMTGSALRNRMSWRFLVASVPFVTRYAIRDIDARISLRERAAVDEWILSSKRFHVIRDHPSHSLYTISGGLWGGTKDAVPNMETLLKKDNLEDTYIRDMDFMRDVIWPMANQSLFQHDSFSCDKFGGGNPFPTARIGLEHVGSVYINGMMRQVDTDLLKAATAPAQCSCI
ncbi:uncharacterized protein LOC123552243 [Mercenaria mercenaria]|uniref:uncharacterized protein LOC123552243 n=1 Tax=Mercenaria mercenaria TaxID=6596 RepID=UPI00234E7FD9|nr:uncharacterized protein LOC123552243 [Mercenaria mercenaria]XP_053381186.1 uncharacterized protein LOC123552243 [Mercenaria mercenaria]